MGSVYYPPNRFKSPPLFFAADYDANLGTYRTQALGGSGSWRLSFYFPGDFNVIDALGIVFQPDSTIGGGETADISSNYAKIGEPFNQNAETDPGLTITGTGGEWTLFDISSVFTNAEAGHLAGVLFDLNGIGTGIDIFGVFLDYR